MTAYVRAVAGFGPDGSGLDIRADPGQRVAADLLTGALTRRGLRPLSRTARLAMVVAAEVLPSGSETSDRDAVVLGSAWASVGPLADFVQVAAEHGADRVFPMAFPNTVVSVHVGHLATLLGITGPAVSVCGEHSGLEAMVEGVSLLEAGRVDRVLAVAADAAEDTVRAARPDQSEAACAVLLAAEAGEDCLAALTGVWVAPSSDELPADVRNRARTVDSVSGGSVTGAAKGALAFARMADRVSRTGQEMVLLGRSGVRGVAALRLEPA